MKIGLTLGGGATRGMAHLGVLTVLDEASIPFDYISACSAGSVIAAIYCAGFSTREMNQMSEYVQWRRIASRNRTSWGLFSFDRLERWLMMFLGDLDFSDLEIPLAIVVADAKTGERIVLKEGRVAKAVHASCAVPGFVNPVLVNGRLMMDGGIVDNLPVSAAREMGADYVVASDVFEPNYERIGSPLARGITAVETLIRYAGGGIETADYLIAPHMPGHSFFSFKHYREFISIGEQAASDNLSMLKNSIAEHRMNHSTSD